MDERLVFLVELSLLHPQNNRNVQREHDKNNLREFSKIFNRPLSVSCLNHIFSIFIKVSECLSALHVVTC